MNRNHRDEPRNPLQLERLLWHAAAGVALGLMILALLGSLRLLDRIVPYPGAGPDRLSAPDVEAPLPRVAASAVERPTG
jgi:hypothetical protein